MSHTDEELLGSAKKGDRAAFGQLVRKFQKRVYATAFHMTGQHSDADDVAQEAFVRAYRGLPSFDGRADFYTWLHRIVVNVALNHLRSRRRSRTVSATGQDGAEDYAQTPAVAAGSTDPRAALESREVVSAVVKALGELSPTLRVTLIMATVEDMPYKMIAQALGIPEGTVAWRVNQARKVMRQRLAGLLAWAEAGESKLDEVLRRSKEALGAH
jgi:RNA polymerase sigma-70 factor, ECF subfamily